MTAALSPSTHSDVMASPEARAFLAAIEADPGSALAKLAFADWLGDQGEPLLEAAWRWCGEHGRCPQRFTYLSHPTEWSWFNRQHERNRDVRDSDSYLPGSLFDLLAAVKETTLGHFNELNFPTLADAVAALALHLPAFLEERP